MSFGRIFHFRKEGKEQLYVRAEFQNIFNRVFLSQPGVGISFFGATNPATPLSQTGNVNSGGYGSIATIGGAGATPRSGQIVARFTF
jgi:hypothetical protein